MARWWWQKPVVENVDAQTKDGSSEKNDGEPQTGGRTIVKVPSPPKEQHETAEGEKHSRKWWEIALAILPIGISTIALLVSYGNRNAAWESANAAKRSADAAVRSAGAAEENVAIAREMLEATTERNRNDQRAKVGVGNIRLGGQLIAGKATEIFMDVINSGKDAALELKFPALFRTTEPPSREVFAAPASSPLQSTGITVPPMAMRTISISISAAKMTEDFAASVNVGRLPLYIYGILTYTDTSKHTYKTYVCASFRNTGTLAEISESCTRPGYNHME